METEKAMNSPDGNLEREQRRLAGIPYSAIRRLMHHRGSCRVGTEYLVSLDNWQSIWRPGTERSKA